MYRFTSHNNVKKLKKQFKDFLFCSDTLEVGNCYETTTNGCISKLIGASLMVTNTVFDRLIATATITFSKENPAATIRGWGLCHVCVAAVCNVYTDSRVADLV